ncbi:hypothetical protein [Actinomadura parmotrematis]|uniref:Aminoglycoside phosphotransferase family protein n=1 Tax=Actinomadura parmotrematis TaxID=2864039 RepID=A0ABS7FPA7_9ACTN|nr:hypothetical protein [Actinomadura parmotrematis]MBW8482225.1 hypothetical protein [Actinomadura parmotrematis]
MTAGEAAVGETYRGLRGDVLREIEEWYPGVRAWRGSATGSCWAYVPGRAGGRGALVEAPHPARLAELVAAAWERP